MIDVRGLTKYYGDTPAVKDLDFSVADGKVTGFLGPNGSGKSTTMRLMLGLDAPSAGSAHIGGVDYRHRRFPLREVGALLEARSVHPGRTARNHLAWLAASNAIPRGRVEEVLELVGLTSVRSKRVGGFSLGMGQRLGIAAALLGDPHTLLLDEPINGLDPEGILWVRQLLRSLAAEGRTVLVSSHLMSEMALTADQLVVIGRGHVIAQGTVEEITGQRTAAKVRVESPDAARLVALLQGSAAAIEQPAADTLLISGLSCREVGTVAAEAGVTLWGLAAEAPSLEAAFMALTRDAGEFAANGEKAV